MNASVPSSQRCSTVKEIYIRAEKNPHNTGQTIILVVVEAICSAIEAQQILLGVGSVQLALAVVEFENHSCSFTQRTSFLGCS